MRKASKESVESYLSSTLTGDSYDSEGETESGATDDTYDQENDYIPTWYFQFILSTLILF